MNREKIIREKAYQLYEIRIRNNIIGNSDEDWYMAELFYKYNNPEILNKKNKQQ